MKIDRRLTSNRPVKLYRQNDERTDIGQINGLMIENKYIEKNFSLRHINARSLSKNLDHLNIYLISLRHMFSVIAVTETWENFTNESLLIMSCYNRIF